MTHAGRTTELGYVKRFLSLMLLVKLVTTIADAKSDVSVRVARLIAGALISVKIIVYI